jgi:hypothetical protein
VVLRARTASEIEAPGLSVASTAGKTEHYETDEKVTL